MRYNYQNKTQLDRFVEKYIYLKSWKKWKENNRICEFKEKQSAYIECAGTSWVILQIRTVTKIEFGITL